MLGGIDPKKMQALMKQMGMSQEEIDASRVIIEKTDGNKLVIDNPSVMKIKIQGQESFQITGEAREEEAGISETDIQAVIEKTGCSKKQAKEALEKADGDLAEAILNLTD
ncbi:MAG: nascent polypeptide-associated complex protein [Nanoarchaeota archaeon]|mgnify:CR=1 FL=1